MKLKILLHLVIELSHLQTWVYMPPIWKGDKNTPSAFYCWGVKTIRFSVCFAFKAMSLWNTVSMTATFRVLLKWSIIMIHYVCLLSLTFMVWIPSHTFFSSYGPETRQEFSEQSAVATFKEDASWMQPEPRLLIFHFSTPRNLRKNELNYGEYQWVHMVLWSYRTFLEGTNDTNSLHSLSQ